MFIVTGHRVIPHYVASIIEAADSRAYGSREVDCLKLAPTQDKAVPPAVCESINTGYSSFIVDLLSNGAGRSWEHDHVELVLPVSKEALGQTVDVIKVPHDEPLVVDSINVRIGRIRDINRLVMLCNSSSAYACEQQEGEKKFQGTADSRQDIIFLAEQDKGRGEPPLSLVIPLAISTTTGQMDWVHFLNLLFADFQLK